MKKFFTTLSLMAIVYVWFFISQIVLKPKPLPISGANSNLTLYVQPAAGRDPILNVLNQARSEILVEVYILSDKEIISALEKAKDRGVKVAVMLEQHPYGGGGNLNPKAKEELTKAGVAVEWANSAFSLTHEKGIVIDGTSAFVMTQNLTASAFTKNREYDVLDNNKQDVSEMRTVFMDDWERKDFQKTIQNDSLLESPNTSRAGLTTLIDKASKEVDLETEDIDDDQIISLLSRKQKTSRVRLLVPALSQVGSNKPSLLRLVSSGVEVRTIKSPYMHAKLILTDAKKAYVGSINLSKQSIDQNRELGMMLTQSDAIGTLVSTFESDWNSGSAFTSAE